MLDEKNVRIAIISALETQAAQHADVAPYLAHSHGDVWYIDGRVDLAKIAAEIVKLGEPV